MFNAFREITGQRGLVNVKVTFTGCLEPCMVGPTVLVLPDYVWYGGVTVDDVPLIVDQHLIGDQPVEWLRIGPAEFALSPLEGRSDLPPNLAPPPGPTAHPGPSLPPGPTARPDLSLPPGPTARPDLSLPPGPTARPGTIPPG